MDFITDIVLNKVILSCVISIIIAQLIKMGVNYSREKRWDLSILLSTGGMPSGHSAVVAALSASVYLTEGATSLFAVVFVIAVITIYDSLTIRKTVGHHTSILNTILRALKLHNKYSVRELTGHSFTQVIAGIVLGIAVALAAFMII